jgi:MFS family permease
MRKFFKLSLVKKVSCLSLIFFLFSVCKTIELFFCQFSKKNHSIKENLFSKAYKPPLTELHHPHLKYYLWRNFSMMLARNLILLYIIKVAKWFMLYMPVSLLFYMENGMEKYYLLLHAIYSGIIALLEVPSGYIADVWGRKPALVLGGLFGVLGFGAYSISSGLAGFLVAEILLGIGSSLLSGADSAILYDTLSQNNQEKRYLKEEGRITAVGNTAETLAGLFVSLIVFTYYRTYFQLQTILAIIAFIGALFLIEPKVHQLREKAGFKDILSIVHTTFRKNKVLRNLIIFASAVGLASLSMAWMAQFVFVQAGLNERHFGIAWVVLNGMVMLGSLSAYRINKLLKVKWSILYMMLIFSVGFFVVGYHLTFAAFIPLALLFYFRGTAHPILKNYINEQTDSSQRATVLSLRSLIIRILFFTLGPIYGFINNKISLEYALYMCAIAVAIPLLVFGTLILLGLKKN